ncbi:MAG: TetR/AcrR family transcriptional regulator [Microbacteriaceae bacterium]
MAATSDSEIGLWRGTAQHTRDQERRQRLLDAALELYGTVGFRATTIQHLCSLAKVSTRSFYELYASQEELLQALYLRLNAEVLAVITDVSIGDEPAVFSVVRGFVAAALEPMLLDERKARVLEVEAVGVCESLERERRMTFRRLAGAIDAALAALAATGRSAPPPGGLTSLILVGGITEALVQRVQTVAAERTSTAEFLDEVSRVIVRVTER